MKEKRVLRGATRWLQEGGDGFRGWITSLVMDRLSLLVTQWSQGLSGLSLERAWLLEVVVTPGQ